MSFSVKKPLQWLWGLSLFLLVFGMFLWIPQEASARDELNPETTYTQAKTAFANGEKEKAVQLFTVAAQAGHTESQYQLGLMYMKGWGVGRNVKEAHRWLTRAEQTGHNQASKAKSVLNSQLDAETRQLLEKTP